MSDTPIADAVAAMLSAEIPPEKIVAFVRTAETGLRIAAQNGDVALKKTEKRRKWDRERKRRNSTGNSTGAKSVRISSSTNDSHKLKVKKESKTPPSGGIPPETDGWPADYEIQFWSNFPKYRRGDRPQVMAWLKKARREKTVEWSVLLDGVQRYAASDPGEYAKAPLPWLRGHRWEIEYVKRGGSNGKADRNGRGGVDPIAAAAARRFGVGGRNGSASGTAGAPPSANGMGDERHGAAGGGQSAFELELRPGPDGVFRGH